MKNARSWKAISSMAARLISTLALRRRWRNRRRISRSLPARKNTQREISKAVILAHADQLADGLVARPVVGPDDDRNRADLRDVAILADGWPQFEFHDLLSQVRLGIDFVAIRHHATVGHDVEHQWLDLAVVLE